MDKIIIHTYPARLWYVKKYLIPSLIAQGAKNIIIANDKYHVGNLLSFVMSLKDCGDAWHLQDDVIVCSNFIERIKTYDGLCCGFVASNFDYHQKITGEVKPASMWFSFPCIRIPGSIAEHFYNWFYSEDYSKRYQKMINSGKMDDLVFIEFLKDFYPDMKVINIKPNLIDHIDYLIGGSVANQGRRGIVKAFYFEEPELVEELKQKLAREEH